MLHARRPNWMSLMTWFAGFQKAWAIGQLFLGSRAFLIASVGGKCTYDDALNRWDATKRCSHVNKCLPHYLWWNDAGGRLILGKYASTLVVPWDMIFRNKLCWAPKPNVRLGVFKASNQIENCHNFTAIQQIPYSGRSLLTCEFSGLN